ncbi:MAG: YchJ family protein [Treponema sp.]|jgi:SEC-C motif-containing protein|nr:YchJ family protein [Treponema sp.]
MSTCPCLSGLPYEECCGPYLSGAKDPPTAEALMRSRYTAYAVHNIDYIMNTCLYNGKTDIDRRETTAWSEQSTWLGLKIIAVEKGGSGDSEGMVEFEASYERNGLKDLHHERARFKKQEGRWIYEDGAVAPVTVVRSVPKVGRNDPCPCGSGKKYKYCHGR